MQEIKDSGATGVFLLVSPVVYIGLANQARNQGFDPIWLGPGITSGLNAVTNFGCPGSRERPLLLAHAGPRRDRLARPGLQAGVRRARRGRGRRRHRAAAVVAQQGDRADARDDRSGARPGGVHEHARDVRPSSTTASTRRSSSRPRITSAAPGRTSSTPTATSSSTRRQSSSSWRRLTMAETVMERLAAVAGTSIVGIAIAVALIAFVVAVGEKQSLVIGTITGAAYGLVALGLVLIYKSSGVFNFAQGEFGTSRCSRHVPAPLPHAVRVRRSSARSLVAIADGAARRAAGHPAAVHGATGDPARRHRRRRAAPRSASRSGSAARSASRSHVRSPELNRLTILGLQISDQRLLLIGTLVGARDRARAVLQPDQPRPRDPRREPGADGDRARRDQRPAPVELHVGDVGAARRARSDPRRPRRPAASPRA